MNKHRAKRKQPIRSLRKTVWRLVFVIRPGVSMSREYETEAEAQADLDEISTDFLNRNIKIIGASIVPKRVWTH